jgi:hypothetical protein
MKGRSREGREKYILNGRGVILNSDDRSSQGPCYIMITTAHINNFRLVLPQLPAALYRMPMAQLAPPSNRKRCALWGHESMALNS